MRWLTYLRDIIISAMDTLNYGYVMQVNGTHKIYDFINWSVVYFVTSKFWSELVMGISVTKLYLFIMNYWNWDQGENEWCGINTLVN